MKTSAGVLLFKREPDQVLLAHPGGPLWTSKDKGFWSIPKGEYADEDPEAAARREFKEETGIEITGAMISLGSVKQSKTKTVVAWAQERDCDPSTIVCNTFSLEWPPRSGKFQDFPEIDRVKWFPIDEAYEYILPGQRLLLFRLAIVAGGVSWVKS